MKMVVLLLWSLDKKKHITGLVSVTDDCNKYVYCIFYIIIIYMYLSVIYLLHIYCIVIPLFLK